MATREPIQIVEFDIDYCTLTYATGLCSASLGVSGDKKCFNTFKTCQSKENFDKGVKTLRFVSNRGNLPKGLICYPVLDSISAYSSTLNIAGSNSKMSAFGRRATVTVNLRDFVDSDIYLDKYHAERISGAAQANGIGYNPKDRGTFFSRLAARFPYYPGRPLRIIDGYLDGGALNVTSTRHYIVTDFSGPDSSGKVSIEASDILTLADDDKAVCPKVSRGKLGSDITNANGQTFNLLPEGIGSEYQEAGYATISSEVVRYTRVGDTITIIERGAFRTVVGSHNANDTFQEAFPVNNIRIDNLVYKLLTEYANIPASYCPLYTKWKPEIDSWMSGLKLNSVITKPTSVKQLLGELADLGVSIWWDSADQEIGLIANHPVSSDQITLLTDRDNIKSVSQEDNNDERYTALLYLTKQTDPSGSYNSYSNYDQVNVIIDNESESENAYNGQIIKKVYCRWLNEGATSVVSVIGKRLLNRFRTPPKTYIVSVDAKDSGIKLADVVMLDTYLISDDTGLSAPRLTQVYKIEESKSGHEIKLYLQDFQFEGRFGRVMPDTTTNTYNTATDDEKETGCFLSDGSNEFSDGTKPYVLV